MKPMKSIIAIVLSAAAGLALAAPPDREMDPAYRKAVEDWRATAEQGLRRDNGWLTLAGRYVLKPGENMFGTGPGNDVVFPPGLGPAGMGSVFVVPDGVKVKMVEGLMLRKGDAAYSEREMGTDPANRDWVCVSARACFHIIAANGKYILRLADNQSEVRKHFGGRVWYDVDDRYRVPAKYVLYEPAKKIPIVNVIDEVSDEVSPGYVEFDLQGRTYRLDAFTEDNGLFLIFRDATAGDTTYGSGRFLYVDDIPTPGKPFTLDLNRAYNPPCAFSAFTTCPLPPKQNVLKVRIEAGEKYPPRKLG